MVKNIYSKPYYHIYSEEYAPKIRGEKIWYKKVTKLLCNSLFNRTNSKELVGKTAVYKKDSPMAYAGYLVKAIPNNRANGTFIATYMNTKYVKSILFNMAKNIVGMANINAEEFKKIRIYIPPIELQNKFAQIVTKIEEQNILEKQAISESENLFNSLMSKYFD